MAVNPLNRRKSTSGRRLSFVFSRRRSETDESASESYHHSAIAGRGISRDESASESYHDHSAGRGISRRLSFVFSRRGSDTDASESYHHSRSNSAGRLPRRSSLRTSISPEASAASDSTAIDPNTQALAVIEADNKKNNFHESLPRSLLAAHADRDCVAPFLRDEVLFGPKLGSGEFSNVYEVQSFHLQEDFSNTAVASEEELDKRRHMKKHQKYRETKNARYAVKHIKEVYHLHHGSDSYIQAAGDLALEAELLASLQHPNIIKLRGISYLGAAGFMHGPSGYFLVIDRLNETLDQRLKRWRGPTSKDNKQMFRRVRRSTVSALSASFTKASFKPWPEEDTNKETNKDHYKKMDERFNIALQLSAALVYLHSHSIIFRDLKPANIGFDVRGDVKIFDFGLARVMPEEGDPNNDAYDMSGAGSPRYMAPECLRGNSYNLKADVYSFSIILWEILTTRTPYAFVRSRHQLMNYVLEEEGRPEINKSWPSSIQGMLESSFYSKSDLRPKMSFWYDIIRETMVSLRDEERFRLNDTWIKRRRSFDSMRNLMKGFSNSENEMLKELTESGNCSASGSRGLRRETELMDSDNRITFGSRRRRLTPDSDFLKEVANSKPIPGTFQIGQECSATCSEGGTAEPSETGSPPRRSFLPLCA